jgi:hypothetical protein
MNPCPRRAGADLPQLIMGANEGPNVSETSECGIVSSEAVITTTLSDPEPHDAVTNATSKLRAVTIMTLRPTFMINTRLRLSARRSRSSLCGLAPHTPCRNPPTAANDRTRDPSAVGGSDACGRLAAMLREFDAQLHKGDNPGAWTCVVMDDVTSLFGTRGLVKIRGAIDGQPFDGALMAQGDGTHRLPVKATLRKAIGKEAGDTVHVRIDERIG